MNYFIYLTRESTGPVIAIYTIAFLIGALFDPHLTFLLNPYFRILSWIALAAAIIHSLTWLWVLPKLIVDSKVAQIIIYIVLLASVSAISCILLPILYV